MNRNTKITPRNESLFDLVRDASEGKLVLPQFQRSFVWSESDVQELLVSVFKQYFIGSLLVMEMDPHDPPFSIRAIEGCAISESSLKGVASRLVLDGQQRVTSIYYAFYAPDLPLKGRSKNSSIFFLDLKKFFGGNIENAIFAKYRSRCKPDELELGSWQFTHLIVPLKDLLDWSKWRNEYSYWLSEDRDKLQAWHQESASLWESRFDSVFKYSSSVLTLDKVNANDSRQLEEICTIFEKLNSTGVNLSVFDLLTARLYPKRVHLDLLWNDAVDESELLSQFDVNKSDFGVFILRCMALIRGVDIKRSALIHLSDVNFNRDWRRVVCYFDEAYKRLTSLQDDGFGVFTQKWLPYTTVIPTLAALLAKRDSLDDAKKALATRAIKWWYWGSVFTVRYTGPVETVMSRDYLQMCRLFEDPEYYPEVFQNTYNEVIREDATFSLLDVERASNTLYKAVMCLLALNDAKDFKNNESITFSQLDDHHIFPKGYLKDVEIDPLGDMSKTAKFNSIANRTLISSSTNKSIGKRAPSDYLSDDTVIPQDLKSEILRRHFVEDSCLQALEQNEYGLFLLERESTIKNEIRSLFEDMPIPHLTEESQKI